MSNHSVEDKASLSGIRREIRAELNRVGADPALSFDCLVAVTEACTNALMHGIESEDDQNPEVSWEINSDVARFFVQDYSDQRWARAAHPSRSPTGLDDRVGGFGVKMMRKLMDEVDIRQSPSGTTVVLVKRLG